jgi:hypothetical protein
MKKTKSMTPEEITNVVRELNEIRDIANADVEKVVGYNTRLQSELDEARAEVERLNKQLKQAIVERTPHDYGILKEEVDYWKAETHRVAKKRDEALGEVELLKQERDLWQQVQRDKATVKESLTVRPEPSRLEIAAMFYSAALTAGAIKLIFDPDTSAGDALIHADALIAASKEDVDEATA